MSKKEFTKKQLRKGLTTLTESKADIKSELKKQSLKSKMLLQVHDELVFDVHKSEKDQIKDIVKTTMESAVKLKVPLKIDLEFGKNWLEAH